MREFQDEPAILHFDTTYQNNIVRCTFSAVLVSVIEPVINAIGVGWTFVIVAGLSFISIPCMFFVMWRGPLLRQRAAMQFPTTKETNPI